MPCLWPSPERGSTIAARPGSARWIARPLGTSAVSPGCRVSGASTQALRSSPAAPGVAYAGAWLRRRGSISFTSILCISFLPFHAVEQQPGQMFDNAPGQLSLGCPAERIATVVVVQHHFIVVTAQAVL